MERRSRRARPTRVRLHLVLPLAGLLGLALVPYPAAPGVAACAAPLLSVEGHQPDGRRVTLVRGEQVKVTGRGFVAGCDDTGRDTSLFGCSGDDSEGEEPMTDIELVVLQGRPTPEQTPLAEADAGGIEDDQLGRVVWTVTVPDTLSPGPAVLKTEGSEPLRVRVR